MGSIPDNKQAPDPLDEGSQQLGMWHPVVGNQDNGNKEKHGTSTAITVECHDAESVNTHGTTLKRDSSDVEEAAKNEDYTATSGILRDPESLLRGLLTESLETRRTSGSQRQLASLKRHWSRRTGQSPVEGHEQEIFLIFLEKSEPILL